MSTRPPDFTCEFDEGFWNDYWVQGFITDFVQYGTLELRPSGSQFVLTESRFIVSGTGRRNRTFIHYQFVSRPLKSFEIRDRVGCSIRGLQNDDPYPDGYWAVHSLMWSLRVVNESGETKFRCASNTAGELAKDVLTSRYRSYGTSTRLTENSDRLVFEVGVRLNWYSMTPQPPFEAVANLEVGDGAEEDLASNDSDTNQRNPWVSIIVDRQIVEHRSVPPVYFHMDSARYHRPLRPLHEPRRVHHPPVVWEEPSSKGNLGFLNEFSFGEI